MELLPLIAVSPLLPAVAYFDLRYLRIPNALALVSLGLFVAVGVFTLPVDDMAQRALIAGVFLVIGFIGFAFGLIGGGDVKMFSALLLFVPPPTFLLFMYVFALSLLAGILLVKTLKAAPMATHGWRSLEPGPKFPMGVSIALAGLAHLVAVLVWPQTALVA